MTRSFLPWSRRRTAAVAATGVLAVVAAGLVAPTGASGLTLNASSNNLNLLGAPVGLDDFDGRTGTVSPSAAQQSIANSLGASVRWNRYGTPQSLINHNGYLATGLAGTDVDAARSFLRSKAALFRLTTTQVDALELLNDSRLSGGAGHVVLFRQKFGSLPAAVDGMVTVAITGGKVAYVSSSIAPTTAAPAGASLSATAAWAKAATNVGRSVGAISAPVVDARTGWTVFKVAGFAQDQRARLRALPTYAGAVRPVFEVNVVDVKGGAAFAYTAFVDAQTGAVLVRHNQVDQSMYNETFQGVITATDCGPLHMYNVDAATKTIVVTASAAVVTNDIVLKLILPSGEVLTSDTATSPEAITYSPTGGVPAGMYKVQVCPFGPNPTVPFTEPGNYAGTFSATETAAPGNVPYPPVWKYFVANPTLDTNKTTGVTDTRKVGCWVIVSMTPTCQNPPSPLNNLAARGPWDYNFRTNTPTFTTEGNAAVTAEAWTSPLTPGPIGQRPTSPNRHYGFDNQAQDFEDRWNNSKCDPTQLVPGGNDILASVTSLFSNHNRIHDWSYFLGFTEANYNLQDNNFGNRAMPAGVSPTGGEGDPEVGNVQAGAVTGGAPSYLGRDNANQITLQDGIPGITNQYLFQPIAGAFYAPCTDGDFDMTVIGHEYNHAISNRMIGGPDANITGFQGGSMGESWGDQVALEYLFEHNYATGAGNKADGTPKLVEGPYVTGNKNTGIRNYALDNSPLQYGDLGYDITGPEVHADGEPWSAVMIDVRQALINKYNGAFPVKNTTLQRRCAQGDLNNNAPQAPLDAKNCPGNRRWIQMLFDAYLMQPPNTSMLDARDAMLAADRMRFGAADLDVMWNAFAHRGFGMNASTPSNDSDQPTPGYMSPFANNGTLQISAQEYDETGPIGAVAGTLFVGRYEARITPVADTNPSSPMPDSVRMVPGTYEFVFQAPGYGLHRITQTIGAGQTVARSIHLTKNLASSFKGATATGSDPVNVVNADKLIDDTESTNFAALKQAAGVQNTKPYVTVNLSGSAPVLVRLVKVSAMLRPPPGQDQTENQPDMSTQSRFTALRQFAIETCTDPASTPVDECAGPTGFTRIYTSPDNAFPSTLPRPLVPDFTLRNFDVPDTMATHIRLVALENQCTGTPEYSGEQDADPANSTDCEAASNKDEQVRAAELEVFGFDSTSQPPGDPVVVTTMTAPATATAGSNVTYTITYRNLGPAPSSNATITDQLPAGLTYVPGSGGTYNATTRTVRWNLGTVSVNGSGTVSLTARIVPGTAPGTLILNQAQFAAAMTYALPAAATTLIIP